MFKVFNLNVFSIFSIGLRQGVLVSKIGLVFLLSKFKFQATTPAKVKFAAATVGLTPDAGFPMRIEHRK